MFTELQADQSVMGSRGFTAISDPAINEQPILQTGGIEQLNSIYDPVENGADKIINFVDKVTSIPQRLELTARELNEYLISVGERVGGESEKVARENLGGFKFGNAIQTGAESALGYIQKNWMVAVAVAVIAFLIFRR